MKKQKISDAVIHRLPRYYRYLDDLYNKGVVRISSHSLGEKMDITASQIRQDLSCFGEFGQQGYGYNVEYLLNEIGEILGLNDGETMIIVGAGNLGRALANHNSFAKRGFTLVGIFMLERPVHSNANGPILFNPSGRATAIRFLHPPNVSVGISVTHSGTVK